METVMIARLIAVVIISMGTVINRHFTELIEIQKTNQVQGQYDLSVKMRACS